MTAKDRLDDVLTEGLFYDIYRAEDALGLYMVIGRMRRQSRAVNSTNSLAWFRYLPSLRRIVYRYWEAAERASLDVGHQNENNENHPRNLVHHHRCHEHGLRG
jgi:hypothetical protein